MDVLHASLYAAQIAHEYDRGSLLLISFVTLIVSLICGICSGLFFLRRTQGPAGWILASVIGAFAGILFTYGLLRALLFFGVIGSVNPDWFIRQCIWLAALAVIGVVLSSRAKKLRAGPAKADSENTNKS